MALKQIKNKIVSTKKTGKVTKAMESVSAVKMRKSQERAFTSRPYIHTAMQILTKVAGGGVIKEHVLSMPRAEGRTLLIVVTSDKGLAGSVNSAVLKLVDTARKENSQIDIIAFGRKAVEYAAREEVKLLASYTNLADEITLEDIKQMAAKVLSEYTESETYEKVEIVYQNFLSTFEQAPTKRQVLPLEQVALAETLAGIKPRKGKFSELADAELGNTQYEIEPDASGVLDVLIPQLVEILLFHAILESKASEHSARMVAMKNATDKSKEVAKFLTLKFNKARQAAITAEVAEITGGMEAMK